MLKNLIRFELRYYLRQLSFYFALCLLLLMGSLLSGNGIGGNLVNVNSPFSIVFTSTQLSTLISIFVVTAFTVHSILRDPEHKFESIIYSSSIDKFQYLISRFSGLLIVSSVVMAAGVIGMYIGHSIPIGNAERIGESNIFYYLWVIVIIIVPNVLFSASLIFATALSTKNIKATYVAGVMVYVLYIVGSLLGNSPFMARSSALSLESIPIAVLLDPFGFIGIFEQTSNWTVAEKNSLLPVLSGSFLYNRLLWTGFSLTVFTASYHYFKFRSIKKERVKKPGRITESFMEKIAYKAVAINLKNSVPAILSKMMIEYKTVIKGIPFIVLMILLAFLVIIELSESILRGGNMDIPLYPHTGTIIPILQEPLSKIGSVVIIFYSAELYWNERGARIHELIDASLTKSRDFLISKFLVILLITMTFISFSIVLAIIFQLVNSYYEIDFSLYFTLFYHAGTALLLHGALTFFIQNFVKSKIIGIAVSLVVVYIFIIAILNIFDGIHPLLYFAYNPEFTYSDMARESFYHESTNSFNLYWGLFAFILLQLTVQFWRRAYRRIRVEFSKTAKFLLLLSIMAFLGAGSQIYYEMNILNDYQTRSKRYDFGEAYEKKYGKYKNSNQPLIRDVKLEINLYPKKRRYDVSGSYVMENAGKKAIKNILLSVRKQNRVNHEIRFANAALESYDRDFNMYNYRLDTELKPGDRINLSFEISVTKSPYDILDPENYVVENGSYVEISKFIPLPGYESAYEIRNSRERRERGLGLYYEMLPYEADKAFPELDRGITYEATISTSSGQTAISQGKLLKSWEENGRSYFHYKNDKKMSAMISFSSANYELQQLEHKGIEVSVYYDKRHDQNVETFLESAKHSLDFCIENFGSYDYDFIKLVELPDFSRSFGGTSYPNTVFFVEDRSFNLNQSGHDGLDVAYIITAHEISHQWWAHQLEPAYMEGYRFQTETMAEYTELSVLEEKYGKEKLNLYLDANHKFYFSNRSWQSSIERPLSIVPRQPYVYYFKGALVMHALKGILGKEKMKEALRDFYRKHTVPKRPVSRDLLNEIYEKADSSQFDILDDLLKRVVIHDLRIESAGLKEGKEGKYILDIETISRKTIITEKETNENVSEYLELAAYRESPSSGAKAVWIKKLLFNKEKSQFRFELDQRVKYVMIDPNRYRIERNRSDNLFIIK